MEPLTIFPGSSNAPIQYAASILQAQGWQIAEYPNDRVTHLLLPIPSIDQDRYIKGSNLDLSQLLQSLPENIHVIGGNLNHTPIPQAQIIDLLKDEAYLAKNAALTAHCALKAVSTLNIHFRIYRCSLSGGVGSANVWHDCFVYWMQR